MENTMTEVLFIGGLQDVEICAVCNETIKNGDTVVQVMEGRVVTEDCDENQDNVLAVTRYSIRHTNCKNVAQFTVKH